MKFTRETQTGKQRENRQTMQCHKHVLVRQRRVARRGKDENDDDDVHMCRVHTNIVHLLTILIVWNLFDDFWDFKVEMQIPVVQREKWEARVLSELQRISPQKVLCRRQRPKSFGQMPFSDACRT